MGYAKFKLKDYNGALEDIKKSINLNNNNSYAFRNRALIYFELNNKDSACMDIKKALELGFTEKYGKEVEDLFNKNCNTEFLQEDK